MELKTCEYCGTSFDASLRQCPLCGKAAEPAVAEPIVLKSDGETAAPRRREKGGKRLAKNRAKPAAKPAEQTENPYAIPKGMMKAICIILGAAVAAGAAFAIYNLKWFAPKDKTDDTQQTIQAEPQPTEPQQPSKEQYMNEEDYTPPKQEETQVEQPAATVTCTALTLSTNTVTFEEAEQFYGITYTREPADCTEEVLFSSDNESIATVNQQGKIVAVNAGSAVITAKCGTQTASCLVTCDFKVVDEEQPSGDEELSLNNTDMTFFSPGEQFTLA
ncbi:protein containing Bacterial Ig-like, group 2 domain protein, partial [human gut metagenome]